MISVRRLACFAALVWGASTIAGPCYADHDPATAKVAANNTVTIYYSPEEHGWDADPEILHVCPSDKPVTITWILDDPEKGFVFAPNFFLIPLTNTGPFANPRLYPDKRSFTVDDDTHTKGIFPYTIAVFESKTKKTFYVDPNVKNGPSQFGADKDGECIGTEAHSRR